MKIRKRYMGLLLSLILLVSLCSQSVLAAGENEQTSLAGSTIVKENEELIIDGITYTIDFHSDGTNRWANLWQVKDPGRLWELLCPVLLYMRRRISVTEIQFSAEFKMCEHHEVDFAGYSDYSKLVFFLNFPATELSIPGSIKILTAAFKA